MLHRIDHFLYSSELKQFRIHTCLQRQYDEKHGSGLYDTLFQYLFQDRSIQKGAEALHIHRNSFLYRIHRIKELTQIDLEDPSARFYLMLSFLLEGSSLF